MKYILALLLSVCVLLSMVACGYDSESTLPTKENTLTKPDVMTSTVPGATQKPTENTKPVHTHTYSDATCTKASVCSCGDVQGVALGHSFSLGYCSRCGAVDPEYEPVHTHTYSDATCTNAPTCTCGAVNGTALGHSYNQGKCTRCDAADPNASSQETTSQIVYVTETGKKYHSRKNCSGLSNAKAIYESTLTAAKNRGLGPCAKCH